MTLEDAVRAESGTHIAHNWRTGGDHVGITKDGEDIIVRYLWHHDTLMLKWRKDKPHDPDYLDYDLGWGSVSDQNGMNRAFRALAIPLRYDRNIGGGGPRIVKCGTVRQAQHLRALQNRLRKRHSWVR